MESNYQRILQLLRPNIIILPQGNNIIDQSFQEQREVIKPLQEAFKENLENYTVTEEDTLNELSYTLATVNEVPFIATDPFSTIIFLYFG